MSKKLEHPSKFVVYPGTAHGFAVRGDAKEPHIKWAAEDAACEAVTFFKRFL